MRIHTESFLRRYNFGFIFRNHMNDIYFGKTNDIFLSLRQINPDDAKKQQMLKEELTEVMKKSAKVRD